MAERVLHTADGPAVALRLRDGRVVAAVKDCECLTHDGPHWLHMDELDRARNRRLLDRRGIGAVKGFAIEELSRLAGKRREMESRGIVEVLRA